MKVVRSEGQTPARLILVSRRSTPPFSQLWLLSDQTGGLNGSMQHLVEVYLQESTKLISFASVDSNGTLPCLGSDESCRKGWFSGGSIVGSTD